MSGPLHNPEFWVLVAFLIVLVFGLRKAQPTIATALDARALRIRTELDEAQRLRADAERTLAEYQRRQRDALKEAEQIVAHAREEAERAGRQAALDLEAALDRRARQAEERIAQDEARAVAEIRNRAVDIAIAAARRLIADELAAGGGAALIDEAIAALPRQLH